MTDDDSPDRAGNARGAEARAECVRRSVLRGGAVLGAVVVGGGLSRIGSGSSSAATFAASANKHGSCDRRTGGGHDDRTGGHTGHTPQGAKKRLVGAASKVPVGGGAIFEKLQVVVTQPTAGVYKAFDAMCTHEKCILADVADGTINCACHGGKFSITDGSAVQIPPVEPLPVKTVTVTGGKIYVS